MSKNENASDVYDLNNRLVLLVAWLSVIPAQALDWPQWRGPKRNDISEEGGWSTAVAGRSSG